MHNKVPENEKPVDSTRPKPIYKGDHFALLQTLNETLAIYNKILFTVTGEDKKKEVMKFIKDIHGLIFDTARVAGLVYWPGDKEGEE